jgi:hypothetical protein
MEAGVAVASEGLGFLKKIVGFALSLAGGVGAVAGGLAKGLGAAGGAATRMGTNLVRSGANNVREFMRDRQYTKELHRSELGGIAKDFGIKMRRSTPEEIREAFYKADVKMQDKGDGVIAFYRFDKFIGIRDKDGSYRGAKFMSEEDRKKYGQIEKDKPYAVINTRTHDFIQAKGLNPINTDNRIGVVKNMEILKNLNKMM